MFADLIGCGGVGDEPRETPKIARPILHGVEDRRKRVKRAVARVITNNELIDMSEKIVLLCPEIAPFIRPEVIFPVARDEQDGDEWGQFFFFGREEGVIGDKDDVVADREEPLEVMKDVGSDPTITRVRGKDGGTPVVGRTDGERARKFGGRGGEADGSWSVEEEACGEGVLTEMEVV